MFLVVCLQLYRFQSGACEALGPLAKARRSTFPSHSLSIHLFFINISFYLLLCLPARKRERRQVKRAEGVQAGIGARISATATLAVLVVMGSTRSRKKTNSTKKNNKEKCVASGPRINFMQSMEIRWIRRLPGEQNFSPNIASQAKNGFPLAFGFSQQSKCVYILLTILINSAEPQEQQPLCLFSMALFLLWASIKYAHNEIVNNRRLFISPADTPPPRTPSRPIRLLNEWQPHITNLHQ